MAFGWNSELIRAYIELDAAYRQERADNIAVAENAFKHYRMAGPPTDDDVLNLLESLPESDVTDLLWRLVRDYGRRADVVLLGRDGSGNERRAALLGWADQTRSLANQLTKVVTREPDRAVCDACGWEGTENDIEQHNDAVTGDTCPSCGQPDVNYFFAG